MRSKLLRMWLDDKLYSDDPKDRLIGGLAASGVVMSVVAIIAIVVIGLAFVIFTAPPLIAAPIVAVVLWLGLAFIIAGGVF